MFQIDRKEYIKMIEALGELGDVLEESRSNFLMQKCEDLVERGKSIRSHMQEAIAMCSGLIDCTAEQEALNEAWRSVKRIETFRLAFQKYVMDVRNLDESLRLDFQTFTDMDVVEAGREMKEAVNERHSHEQRLAEVKRILGNPPQEWSLQETAFLQENQEMVKAGVTMPFLGYLGIWRQKVPLTRGNGR